jgi:ferritin
MLSATMQTKLLEQAGKEWDSEYYYMAMGAWCYNNELDGFGAWFEQQASEEHTHGLRILHYIRDVGGQISIPAINPIGNDFSSLRDTFEKTLEHEQLVTRMVHDLVSQARQENDHTTDHFLQWFVSEQVEEESTARAILAKVKRAGDNPSALFLLEQQLAPAAAKAGGEAAASE